MSVKRLIDLLTRLVDIHQNLLDLSMEKTEIIKSGSIDKLQSLLAKERKYIQLVEQTEKERIEESKAWFKSQKLLDEEMTITKMLENLDNESDKEALATVTTELTNKIASLKQQEQLNRNLIEQSMQFIHLSLDMLHPSIQQMNYHPTTTVNEAVKQSVFDSKA